MDRSGRTAGSVVLLGLLTEVLLNVPWALRRGGLDRIWIPDLWLSCVLVGAAAFWARRRRWLSTGWVIGTPVVVVVLSYGPFLHRGLPIDLAIIALVTVPMAIAGAAGAALGSRRGRW